MTGRQLLAVGLEQGWPPSVTRQQRLTDMYDLFDFDTPIPE